MENVLQIKIWFSWTLGDDIQVEVDGFGKPLRVTTIKPSLEISLSLGQDSAGEDFILLTKSRVAHCHNGSDLLEAILTAPVQILPAQKGQVIEQGLDGEGFVALHKRNDRLIVIYSNQVALIAIRRKGPIITILLPLFMDGLEAQFAEAKLEVGNYSYLYNPQENVGS